jgi:hypothetical protein
MQGVINVAGVIGALIGACVALLAIVVMVGALAWNCLNRLRLIRVVGGEYAINHIEDPPGTTGVGHAIRSRIADELSFARRSARTARNVDSPDAAVPAQLAALPESIKGLTPLLNLLLRQNRFVITVTVLPLTSENARIYVMLSRSGGTVLESRSFAVPAGNKADAIEAYTAAAIRAGAWLAFMLEKYVRSRITWTRGHHVELLGTRSWESYALLCQGLRHATSEDERLAWYNAALREDHRNIGALIAFGGTLATHEKEIDFAINHLEWARKLLGGDSAGRGNQEGMRKALRFEHAGTHADPQWFQATYALAIALLHRHDLAAGPDRQPHDETKCLADAIKKGAELAQAVGATRLTLASRWRRLAIQRGRRAQLRMILGREDTTLASVVAASKASLEMQEAGHLLPVEDGWKPCEKSELWKRLNKLDSEHPDSLPSAEGLLNAQLCFLGCDNDEECHLDQRTRYNRACFYVRSEKYDKALRELSVVFAHISSSSGQADGDYSYRLLDWARKDDPALRPLRSHRTAEFKELVDRASAAMRQAGVPYPDIKQIPGK